MVSAETLLSYLDWKIIFILHIYASDKKLDVVISQNNKHIALFSRRLRNLQCNYTTTKKEIIVIAEWLKKSHRIISGYEINVFSYNKNLVYATNLSESQRVMNWWLIIEEFGPNIQNIAGVENIVSDKLIRLPPTSFNKHKPSTSNYQCCANKLFVIDRVEKNDYCFPLNILNLKREQQKELIKINFKLSA